MTTTNPGTTRFALAALAASLPDGARVLRIRNSGPDTTTAELTEPTERGCYYTAVNRHTGEQLEWIDTGTGYEWTPRPDPRPVDSSYLDMIAEALNTPEWNSETVEIIAGLVAASGRTFTPEGYEPERDDFDTETDTPDDYEELAR